MLSGFWARPTNALRLTFDPELFWADSAFACIDPRQQQRFRFQAAHTPASWISLSASFDILEHRSNMALVNGNTLFLNPNTPVGPSRYANQRPYAGSACELVKGLTYKTTWTYYGYNPRSMENPVGLAAIGDQDFNGNNVTLALRYSF